MTFVCADCFEDPALKRVVLESPESDTCSFCESEAEEGIATSVETVAEHVEQCLLQHFDEAANCLPYDGREGGYQGETWDTLELLDHIGFEDYLADSSDGLRNAICESITDYTWCERDPFSMREHRRLELSWESFCNFVKHERRFFFLNAKTSDPADGGDRLFDPGILLRKILGFCLDQELITSVSSTTVLYRVRRQRGKIAYRSALELGSPPPAKTIQANRVSPPGVPMTYLAEDEATALLETADPGEHRYAIGEFELLRELAVLDLTKIPPIPSLFELEQAHARAAIIFLWSFAKDFSKPIARDDRIHVEYVPTQVMTEYFRVAPELRTVSLSGIRYPSSRQAGGVSLALFGGREVLELTADESKKLDRSELDLRESREPLLRLRQSTARTFAPPTKD